MEPQSVSNSQKFRRLQPFPGSLKEMTEIRQLTQMSFEIAGVMFVVVGKDHKITLVNEKACEVLGYKRSEIIGKDWFDEFVPQKYKSEAKKIFDHVVEPSFAFCISDQDYPRTERYNFPILTRTGDERIIAWSSRAILNEYDEVVGMLSSGMDITDIIKSERMATLGEVTTDTAHELSAPIGTIQGLVDCLEMQLESLEIEDESITHVTRSIKGLTDRMLRIIRGIRMVAREGKRDPFQPTQISQLVKDVAELSREGCRQKGIHIEFNTQNESVEIACRETEITRVLLNLVANAKDAIQDLDEKWIRFDVTERPTFVEIAITDSGRGIPSEIADRIMQPLFTTKKAGKGTGLGLSICANIAEGHHGSLTLDREFPNTRFVLRLPKTQQE